MYFVLATLLSLSTSVIAGSPNLNKRDDHPGGAAAIESAVTNAYTETNLPADLTTLGPALSSAGVTGVVISDSTYGTSQPTGMSQGNNNDNENGHDGDRNHDDNNRNDQGNENGQSSHAGSRTSDGLAPATAVPQVLMAGTFGAVGMAVLGLL